MLVTTSGAIAGRTITTHLGLARATPFEQGTSVETSSRF